MQRQCYILYNQIKQTLHIKLFNNYWHLLFIFWYHKILPLCTCGFIFSVYKIIRGSLKKLIFHFVEINAVNIKIQFDNIQNHIVITNNNNCKRLILFFNNFWTVCIATWNLNMDILNCLLKSQSGVQMTYNKQLIFCLSVQ